MFLSVTAALPVEEEVTKEKRSAQPGIVSAPEPVEYTVGAKIAVAGPPTGGALLSQLVEVQNNVAVPHPVPVPQPIPIALPVPVSHPVPYRIPIPVPVVKNIPIPVENPVPYPVIQKVPVEVIKKVPVPVPQPYPVKVPIYKTRHIYYEVRPTYGWKHSW